MVYMNLFILLKKIKNLFYLLLNYIFGLPHIIFFLIKNREIFNYDNILILYHWAFGHQVLMNDYYLRYCLSNKIKFIAIQLCETERTNQHLHKLYQKYYKTLELINSSNKKKLQIYNSYLLFLLRIINKFKKIKILNYRNFYFKNFENYKPKNKIFCYNENTKKIEEHSNHNYWMEKFNEDYPKLNHDLGSFEVKCENFLKSYNIDTNRKIVNIFFRDLVHGGKFYMDNVRNSYNPINYIKSIKWLEKNGYNIFIRSDEHVFEILRNNNFTNTFFLESFKFKFDIKLLDIYLYSKSTLHICQNSGSHFLAYALNTEIMMLDCFPLGEGIPEGTVLCPKIQSNGKILNFFDYCNTNLIYGKGIDFQNTKILPNTEEEIFEVITKKHKSLILVNDKIPKECLAMHRKNKIFASK